MKKRIISLMLLMVMVLSVSVSAADIRARVNVPVLSISGTTASCSVDYRSENSTDTVKITLALWCGENIVDSWTETDTGRVVMSESCRIVAGNTYTLVMMPVINGTAEDPVSVSARS